MEEDGKELQVGDFQGKKENKNKRRKLFWKELYSEWYFVCLIYIIIFKLIQVYDDLII